MDESHRWGQTGKWYTIQMTNMKKRGNLVNGALLSVFIQVLGISCTFLSSQHTVDDVWLFVLWEVSELLRTWSKAAADVWSASSPSKAVPKCHLLVFSRESSIFSFVSLKHLPHYAYILISTSTYVMLQFQYSWFFPSSENIRVSLSCRSHS